MHPSGSKNYFAASVVLLAWENPDDFSNPDFVAYIELSH